MDMTMDMRSTMDHVGVNSPVEHTNPPVLVIMGVSGCGKSTVSGLLAGLLGWRSQEGDDLHPAANVRKMASGQALTDDDRWPWLQRVAEWIDTCAVAGTPGIITCSALKRSYRDVLRRDNVVFVFLSGSRELIGQRLLARTDHYMPPSLLESQIATLEPPGPDEQVLRIDAGGDPHAAVTEIVEHLDLHGTRSDVVGGSTVETGDGGGTGRGAGRSRRRGGSPRG